jgi:sterol-4alpha-carboxylate 3-dehydrogenase (decarboxylating)
LLSQAYHITNDEPIFFWTFMIRMVTGLGYNPPFIHLPYWLVYIIAVILMVISKVVSPVVTFTPTFTPMKVALAGTHHYYSCSRAKQELGYKPVVSLDEAIQKTLESFSHLRKGGDWNKTE